jgi:hypothetical protein
MNISDEFGPGNGFAAGPKTIKYRYFYPNKCGKLAVLRKRKTLLKNQGVPK